MKPKLYLSLYLMSIWGSMNAQVDSAQSPSNGLLWWFGRTRQIVNIVPHDFSGLDGMVKCISWQANDSSTIESIYYGCYVDGRQVGFDVFISSDEIIVEYTCSHQFDASLARYVLNRSGKPKIIVERDQFGNVLCTRRYDIIERIFCKRIRCLDYFYLFQTFYWKAMVATSPKLLYWSGQPVPGDIPRPKWVRKSTSFGEMPRCLYKE